jgi:hypothetical protein
VIFLIDESAAMATIVADMVSGGRRAEKSNAERVATALNSLLNQLSRGPNFDVAVVGYRSDEADQLDVGVRWAGPLAGREFVATSELAAAPLRVETRTRKLPAAGGFGPAVEEPVSFPVWYEPAIGSKAPQIAAYRYSKNLIEKWLAENGPSAGEPVVVHVTAGASGDGNPQKAVEELLQLSTPTGKLLILQAHLASSPEVMSSLYPTSHIYLTLGTARDMFRRVSPLPADMIDALKQAKVSVNPGASGLLYNAKIADVIRLFGLVASHTKLWPSKGASSDLTLAETAQPQAETSPEPCETPAPIESSPASSLGEKAGMIVMLLDRSVEDPFGGNLQNACVKLQDHANNLLQQVSKLADGAIEVGIASYGLDGGGQPEVRLGFEGPFTGRVTVPQTELAAGAIRVEEFEEEMSNGVGGLIQVKRKKTIFFEQEPTAAAPATEAFAAVAKLVGEWCEEHPTACLPPVVLHLTRGQADTAEIEQAAVPLRAVTSSVGPAVLYHLVATEAPHSSLAYPDAPDELATPALQKLWELTSPLLGATDTEKPLHGLVVNGKFDKFLDEIKTRMTS